MNSIILKHQVISVLNQYCSTQVLDFFFLVLTPVTENLKILCLEKTNHFTCLWLMKGQLCSDS